MSEPKVGKRKGNGREIEEKFGMDGNSPLVPQPATPLAAAESQRMGPSR